MTLRFQFVDASPEVQQAFDQLARTLIDTGGRQVGVRFGSSSVTWPGATPTSTQKDVAHGLGRTPVFAVAWGKAPANVNAFFRENAAADSTNIHLVGVESDLVTSPANGTTQNFYWLVLG